VRRADDELRAPGAAVGRHPALSEPNEVVGDVHCPDLRAAVRQQHRVRTGAAPEVDDPAALYVAQEVVGVLERIGGAGGRRDVAGKLDGIDPERGVRSETGFDGTALYLGAFPCLHRLPVHHQTAAANTRPTAEPDTNSCRRVDKIARAGFELSRS
jgi:hypothetical protein